MIYFSHESRDPCHPQSRSTRNPLPPVHACSTSRLAGRSRPPARAISGANSPQYSLPARRGAIHHGADGRAWQISWKYLRTFLGTSRLSMASEAEVLADTGFVRGAVTPLGLPHPMRILADQSVFMPTEISIGSGVRGVAIILKPTDLQGALSQLEIGKFAV